MTDAAMTEAQGSTAGDGASTVAGARRAEILTRARVRLLPAIPGEQKAAGAGALVAAEPPRRGAGCSAARTRGVGGASTTAMMRDTSAASAAASNTCASATPAIAASTNADHRLRWPGERFKTADMFVFVCLFARST